MLKKVYIADNGSSVKILAGNLAVDLKVPDSTEPTTSIILQNLWLDKKGKLPNWIAMPEDIQHQRFIS